MSGIPASQSLAEDLAAQLVAQLAANGRTLATAESCTGGWIAQAITSVSGATTATFARSRSCKSRRSCSCARLKVVLLRGRISSLANS